MFYGVDEYRYGNCFVMAEHGKYNPNVKMNAFVWTVGTQTIGSMVSPFGRVVVTGRNRAAVISALNTHYRIRALISARVQKVQGK